MKPIWSCGALGIGLWAMLAMGQQSTLQITSPAADTIVSSAMRLEARIDPPVDGATVTFFVDGRLVCTAERAPFGCGWDPGGVIRGHHVRVVATLPDGRRLVENVRTKDLGYTEKYAPTPSSSRSSSRRAANSCGA